LKSSNPINKKQNNVVHKLHSLPNLETERLYLRRVDKMMPVHTELRSNVETMKYIPRPLLKSTEDALEHIAMIDAKIENSEGINWAITQKMILN
jgi:ribosomal-protein-alanine N-acetyltransferase